MLQSCARVTIGPRWNSYFVCGFTGYAAGLCLAMSLSLRADLPLLARLAIALTPGASLLIAIRITTLITGRERIVFYEKALVAVLSTAVLAWLGGAPFRVALDISTLGVGVFLAFGRIGCLRVGCCYGRPWRHGIRYGYAHVAAGFDARLRDVPLLPIQIVDGAVSAALTLAGTIVALGDQPGAAAALYALGYGSSRFVLELFRGDERPYFYGVSEAQCIAVATAWLVVPLCPVPIVACAIAATLTAGAAVLVLARRKRWLAAFWFADPRHLREIDAMLRSQLASSGSAPVRTREGLALSVHVLPDNTLDVVATHDLAALNARTLRGLARQLGRRWEYVDAFPGRTPGLVHLLLRDTR